MVEVVGYRLVRLCDLASLVLEAYACTGDAASTAIVQSAEVHGEHGHQCALWRLTAQGDGGRLTLDGTTQ